MRKPPLEFLESRCLLSAVGFVQHDGPVNGNATIARLADLDGDGDLDAVTFRGDGWSWFENTGGEFSQSPSHTAMDAEVCCTIQAADLDSDNDIDLVFEGLERTFWQENVNGTGSFGDTQELTTFGRFVLADFDVDGDVDIVSSSEFGRELVIQENSNGEFTSTVRIDRNGPSLPQLATADINRDDYLDLLYVATGLPFEGIPSILRWYPGLADGEFGEPVAIGESENREDVAHLQWVTAIKSADVDGDLDLDVVIGSRHGIGWYENLNEEGDFGSYRQFSDLSIASIHVADMDLDGDVDIVATSRVYPDIQIVWFENYDGMGDFDEPIVVFDEVAGRLDINVASIAVGDIDGDQDVDLLSPFGWFQSNASEPPPQVELPGDANSDGSTDFEDFLIIANNFGKEDAVFADGDFDGDGRVSLLDFLVLAENFGAHAI